MRYSAFIDQQQFIELLIHLFHLFGSFIPKTMSRPRWNDRQQNAKELEWSDDEDNEDVEVDIQHKKIGTC